LLQGELAQAGTDESAEYRLQAAGLAEQRLQRVHGLPFPARLVALAADQEPPTGGRRDEGGHVGERDWAVAFDNDGVGEVLHEVGLEERVGGVAGAGEGVQGGGVRACRPIAARFRVGLGEAFTRFGSVSSRTHRVAVII